MLYNESELKRKIEHIAFVIIFSLMGVLGIAGIINIQFGVIPSIIAYFIGMVVWLIIVIKMADTLDETED